MRALRRSGRSRQLVATQPMRDDQTVHSLHVDVHSTDNPTASPGRSSRAGRTASFAGGPAPTVPFTCSVVALLAIAIGDEGVAGQAGDQTIEFVSTAVVGA